MFTSPFTFVSSADLFSADANPIDSLTMHDVNDLSFLDVLDASSSSDLNNDNLFTFDPSIPSISSAAGDETDLFDQSAADSSPNNPFLLTDISANDCLSPSSRFRKIRMRSSAICPDPEQQQQQQQNGGASSSPSLSPEQNSISSPAIAKAVDASIRRRWCPSSSVAGFGNIPVCNVGNSEEYENDMENSEERAVQAAGLDVDSAVVALSQYRNILSCYLSEFVPSDFFFSIKNKGLLFLS